MAGYTVGSSKCSDYVVTESRRLGHNLPSRPQNDGQVLTADADECYVSCVGPSYESSFTSIQQSHTETKHIIKFYKFNIEQNQSKYKHELHEDDDVHSQRNNTSPTKCREVQSRVTAGCDDGR